MRNLLPYHGFSGIMNIRNEEKERMIWMEGMVKTNIGEMPIEDYRDIKARQLGFEDYEDMYNQGYRFGDKYDYEETRQPS